MYQPSWSHNAQEVSDGVGDGGNLDDSYSENPGQISKLEVGVMCLIYCKSTLLMPW